MIVTESVSVAGVRLVYDTAGAGDPPMIFIHGWCCDRSFFAPQFAHFAAGHAVAAMDLRGHGESDATFRAYDDSPHTGKSVSLTMMSSIQSSFAASALVS